jgi:hypothetical protein
MKAIIFAVCMCIVSASFAVETSTDCPMMREKNERSNPKATMALKSKTNNRKGTVSSQ